MAQRRTTARQRQALADDLREAGRRGELRPGDPIPTVRELSARYGLSVRTIAQEIQRLVADGLLVTRPRQGTFLAGTAGAERGAQLLLAPATSSPYANAPHIHRIRRGFEERVAELGGATLTLPLDVAAERARTSDLPEVQGIVDAANSEPAQRWYRDQSVPQVWFGAVDDPDSHVVPLDRVYFDDHDGGRQATRHLQRLGHERIAFLGLHRADDTSPLYLWSLERARGWLETTGNDAGMVHLPPEEPQGWDDEVAKATVAARSLVAEADCTAVVAASDHAAMGLARALTDAGVAPRDWPAMISFDDFPDTDSYVLTSIRLPWERLGQTAADMVWERKRDPTRAVAHRLVAMQLIPRLSSPTAWSLLQT